MGSTFLITKTNVRLLIKPIILYYKIPFTEQKILVDFRDIIKFSIT